MQTVMKWGAMYGCLEDGETITRSAALLGDQLIMPGDRISRIGKKKRSMFSMQEGFYLVFQGTSDGYLVFTSEPTGCDGDPWYYVFAYVNPTILVLGSAKGCMDIRVDDLVLA